MAPSPSFSLLGRASCFLLCLSSSFTCKRTLHVSEELSIDTCIKSKHPVIAFPIDQSTGDTVQTAVSKSLKCKNAASRLEDRVNVHEQHD